MNYDREQEEVGRPTEEDIAGRLEGTDGRLLSLGEDGSWRDVVTGAVADGWQDLLS